MVKIAEKCNKIKDENGQKPNIDRVPEVSRFYPWGCRRQVNSLFTGGIYEHSKRKLSNMRTDQ